MILSYNISNYSERNDIMKKISENACCARCKMRGEEQDGFFLCKRKGKVRQSDVCKKYVFDPFAPRPKRKRNFDASMFDPLDFEL